MSKKKEQEKPEKPEEKTSNFANKVGTGFGEQFFLFLFYFKQDSASIAKERLLRDKFDGLSSTSNVILSLER